MHGLAYVCILCIIYIYIAKYIRSLLNISSQSLAGVEIFLPELEYVHYILKFACGLAAGVVLF